MGSWGLLMLPPLATPPNPPLPLEELLPKISQPNSVLRLLFLLSVIFTCGPYKQLVSQYECPGSSAPSDAKLRFAFPQCRGLVAHI